MDQIDQMLEVLAQFYRYGFSHRAGQRLAAEIAEIDPKGATPALLAATRRVRTALFQKLPRLGAEWEQAQVPERPMMG
ncbi:MAG: hypothetical protein C0486_00510 [Erythrobacter sp.]|nr:hypothetical protein [Erythrobacter sp.]